MKKIVALLMVMAIFGGTLSGCANIQDDGTRTKTEGTMVGAGAGALLGATVGYFTGGTKGALIGAGAGAAAGGLAGFFVGTHIANKKKEYANEEAWLDACLQRAEDVNNRLKAYNAELTGQVASLDQETKKLQKDYAARTADRNQLLAEQKKLEGKIAENKDLIAGIEKEIAGQKQVLADAQANRRSDEGALLEAEIAALQRQKAKLEEANKQLAAMSARVSV
jgi:chromosome segregation ATPase